MINKLDHEMICTKCHCLIVDCRRATCGHWFCQSCVEDLIKNKPAGQRSVPCPDCDHPIIKRSMKEDDMVQVAIDVITQMKDLIRAAGLADDRQNDEDEAADSSDPESESSSSSSESSSSSSEEESPPEKKNKKRKSTTSRKSKQQAEQEPVASTSGRSSKGSSQAKQKDKSAHKKSQEPVRSRPVTRSSAGKAAACSSNSEPVAGPSKPTARSKSGQSSPASGHIHRKLLTSDETNGKEKTKKKEKARKKDKQLVEEFSVNEDEPEQLPIAEDEDDDHQPIGPEESHDTSGLPDTPDLSAETLEKLRDDGPARVNPSLTFALPAPSSSGDGRNELLRMSTPLSSLHSPTSSEFHSSRHRHDLSDHSRSRIDQSSINASRAKLFMDDDDDDDDDEDDDEKNGEDKNGKEDEESCRLLSIPCLEYEPVAADDLSEESDVFQPENDDADPELAAIDDDDALEAELAAIIGPDGLLPNATERCSLDDAFDGHVCSPYCSKTCATKRGSMSGRLSSSSSDESDAALETGRSAGPSSPEKVVPISPLPSFLVMSPAQPQSDTDAAKEPAGDCLKVIAEEEEDEKLPNTRSTQTEPVYYNQRRSSCRFVDMEGAKALVSHVIQPCLEEAVSQLMSQSSSQRSSQRFSQPN